MKRNYQILIALDNCRFGVCLKGDSISLLRGLG